MKIISTIKFYWEICAFFSLVFSIELKIIIDIENIYDLFLCKA